MSRKLSQPLNFVPLRVLIADNHPVVRLGVQQILETNFSPLEFGEAETGQQVLDMVRGATWDLLVLDIGLPGRSGLEIMPELKRLAPDLRILILTMHAKEQIALRMFKHILRKLNLHSTQEIAYYAIRGGLIDWPHSS